MTATCASCGTQAACAEGSIPAGWTLDVDRGRVRHICRDCARTNIRAIEGKLDIADW